MKLRAIWSFVAGDSRRAPLAVCVAIGFTLALGRWVPAARPWTGALFVAVIAAGLVAGVFEESS